MREILMQEYVGDKSPQFKDVFRGKDQQLEELISVGNKQSDLQIKSIPLKPPGGTGQEDLN